jgi:hypothetical protein
MKLLIFVLLCFAPMARADSLMPSLVTVGSYLSSNSSVPITQQANMQLSRNILNAQSSSTCSYCGPESLLLSEDSVLRAIDLYLWAGVPISSATLQPLVWLQSTIAINPDATVGITPSRIDFGEAPVNTPEPSVMLLFVLGLACMCAAWLVSRRKRLAEVIGGGE